MPNTDLRLIGRSTSRGLFVAALTCLVTLWSTMAMATITQGDFSVFGQFYTRWAGRWGEGSAADGAPSDIAAGDVGVAPTKTGGSFDFNHWDLVEARSVADIRPDYHFVKNYNLLGRLDTLVLKDADFFAVYRGWYDAEADIKHKGVAETARDWTSFTDRQKQQEFIQDTLREYYGQLNFTDNFSMRVGKQQVIWSEADALSGTEVTNPVDFRYHWDYFETPEDERENLRMVKFNYILPDFLKTANNEFEFFWIPGDYENPSQIFNTTDARAPYVAMAALNAGTDYNEEGQPFRDQLFADAGQYPMTCSAALGKLTEPPGNGGCIQGPAVISTQNKLSNSIDNSEFGARYSTLLPIGNGLQTSLIYLYEARQPKLGFCVNCPPPPNAISQGLLNLLNPGAQNPYSNILPAGAYFVDGPVWPVLPAPGVPVGHDPLTGKLLSLVSYTRQENVRQHYFGMTGTYYDKDLTDIVYRYDVLYAPKIGVNYFDGPTKSPSGPVTYFPNSSGAKWSEETRWIVAGDRPTYIPWISKQHTFLTFQYVMTWYPDRPANAVPNFATDVGKLRQMSNFAFLASTNWLMNGQWTATNVMAWDWDDNCGEFYSENSYRYSRNVLFAVNALWNLGRSGRYTDPYAFSRGVDDNELEFRVTYEI